MTDRFLTGGLASLLLLTVTTQLFYVGVVSGSSTEMLRPLTWFIELFAYCALAVGALVLAARRPMHGPAWALLAIASLLNVLQVSMGLSMFGPAMAAAGEMPQLFETILSGAFFFYFLAKFLLGFAGVALGVAALRGGGAIIRSIAAAAILGGLVAIAFSLLAMIDAGTWRFAAGAAGTAVAALIAALLLVKRPLAAD